MKLADLITEARAIDQRAASGQGTTEDGLRAIELVDELAAAVDAEPSEAQQVAAARALVRRLGLREARSA